MYTLSVNTMVVYSHRISINLHMVNLELSVILYLVTVGAVLNTLYFYEVLVNFNTFVIFLPFLKHHKCNNVKCIHGCKSESRRKLMF